MNTYRKSTHFSAGREVAVSGMLCARFQPGTARNPGIMDWSIQLPEKPIEQG